jgi:hypothetical protein
MAHNAHLEQLGRDLSHRCLRLRQDQHACCELGTSRTEVGIYDRVSKDRPRQVYPLELQ